MTNIKNQSEASFYTLEGLFHLLKRVKKSDYMDMVFFMAEGNAVNQRIVSSETKFPSMLLPDDIIVKILSYLSLTDIATKVSLVNKRMKRICLDIDLWTRLVLPSWDHLSYEAADIVVARCKKVVELDVSKRECDEEEKLALEALGRSSKNGLKKLTVGYCSLTLLQAISRSGLTSLQVDQVNNEIFTNNVANLANLTELILAGNSFQCDYWRNKKNQLLSAIGHNCRKLVLFSIGMAPYEEAVTALLAGGLSSTLRELSFEPYKHVYKSLGAHSVSMGPELGKCTLLEKLVTGFSSNLSLTSRNDFQKIYNNLHNLKNLQLYCCQILTAADYINAFGDQKFGNIVNLKLNRCYNLNDEGLGVMAENCPNLIHLSLSDSREISNNGLRQLLIHCRQLEQLKLCNVGDYVSILRQNWRTRIQALWGNRKCPLVRSVTGEAFAGVDTPALRLLEYSGDTFTKEDIEKIKRERQLLRVRYSIY